MKASSSDVAKAGLGLLKRLAKDTRELRLPPDDGAASPTEKVLPLSIVRVKRGYLEQITHQLNGSYHHGWYDACAVMMRRLVETLIIEVFEEQGMPERIQTESGDYMQLKGLIGCAIGEPAWNLGRVTKHALTEIKKLGDNSAHGRRFTAHRGDIDNMKTDFRVAVQELVNLSGLG